MSFIQIFRHINKENYANFMHKQQTNIKSINQIDTTT